MIAFIGRLYRNHGQTCDRIFYLLFAFCYAHRFVGSTLLLGPLPSFLYKASYGAALSVLSFLLLLELCAEESRTLRLIKIGIPACGLLYGFSGGNLNIVALCCLIALSAGKDAKKIVSIALGLGVTLLCVTFLASQMGYIPYYIYDNGGHNFGSVYSTDFAAHIFYFLLIYRVLKKERFSRYQYIGLAVFTWYLYRLTRARATLICMLLFLVVCGFIDRNQNEKKKGTKEEKEPWSSLRRYARSGLLFGLHMVYVLMACGSFLAVLCFQNVRSYPRALQTVGARLEMSRTAFQQYGVTLLGQKIYEKGNGGIKGDAGAYFFLDCSYVRILIINGILIFVIALVICTYLQGRALARGQWYLAAALSLIALHSVIEHHLLEFWYNTFVLLAFSRWESDEAGMIPKQRI